ncbi:MAG: FtsW/RodA/SpoVE family cell cycle protein [Clostridia bacterium]|nr:FtsW/RodA/SpoVE family cell cycle protein [Clostridia bacterium]
MFSFIKKAWKETDKLLLLLCFSLSVFGVLMVASASHRTLEDGQFLSRDAIVMIGAMLLGLVIAMVISFIDYDLIFKLWPLIALGSVFLMLLLLTPLGVAPDARPDARSWLKITSSLYLQPSEILKIGFIITFSYHLSKTHNDLGSLLNVLLLCLHAAIPIGLVVITGDMGSALIFALMFLGMMFVSGVHWVYFPAGLLAVGAAAPIVWYKVFDNIQRNRILALFHPDDYPKEMYHQRQALNAMKNGGFFGTGYLKGDFTQSGSVPESQNDMIFSAVGEEFGFIGAVLLLTLFVLLAIRIVQVGKRSNNFAACLLCYGVMFMIMSQVIVNVGMCISLLPVIGITLPFLSAGGSSVICLYLAIGLVLSVHRSSQGIHYDSYRYARIALES